MMPVVHPATWVVSFVLAFVALLLYAAVVHRVVGRVASWWRSWRLERDVRRWARQRRAARLRSVR
jgi:hypothetical protein